MLIIYYIKNKQMLKNFNNIVFQTRLRKSNNNLLMIIATIIKN